MILLLLEALLAMVLLIFIVWWTMFSGRKNGEIKPEAPAQSPVDASVEEPVQHAQNGPHHQEGPNGPADKP